MLIVGWRKWLAPTLAVTGLAWCVIVGLLLWVTPVKYNEISDGVAGVRYLSFSSVSDYGPLPLIVPALIAAMGALGACARYPVMLGIAATLLMAFALISGFTIGGAYVVPAGLLFIATVFTASLESARRRAAGR